MPNVTTCPEVSVYQQLTAGQVPEHEKGALLQHLESCHACARRLAALPEPDTLVSLLRRGETIAEGASRQTIEHLIGRLSQLRPISAPVAARVLGCPGCRKPMQIRDELTGKQVRCPHCGQGLVVPAVTVAAPMATRSFAPEGARRAGASTHGGASAAAWQASTVDGVSARSIERELYSFLAPPQAPDERGRLGPYRVLQVLGAGGMGVVFRAEDPQLMRLVALKAMLPALAANESARQRFLREARAAAAIKHDHIVTIYQVGEDRNVPFLAMEFLEGESLEARLQREGTLPAGEVLRIGREMALGLAAAHARGLIHRDIKPANIWLEGEHGRVKVLDFGLARSVGAEAQVTQLGVIVGTPAFMAPEQAQGKPVDPRCDLFSLGCVLYRLATGAAAFHGTDLVSTILAVTTHHPAPPHQRNTALPPALSALIMSLLAKDANDRPASAHLVAESLDCIAREPGTPAALPPTARPVVRRLWPIAAGVAACLLAALAALAASGVFRLKTKAGIIVLEDLPADARVIVDGETLRIEGAAAGKPIEVRVAAGKHKLSIQAPGFKLQSQDVTLQAGDHQPIRFRLEPLAAAPNGPASPLPSRYKNRLGMEFALIPRGKAWLGGGAGRPGNREVEFKHGFYLGVYELTQQEWQAVTGSNPSSISRNGAGKLAVKDVSDDDLKRFPAESVSWKMVQLFLEQLNKRENEAGWMYRLPTEDEWEYACRGGPNPRRLESAYEWYFDKPTSEAPTTAQLNFWGHFKRTCKVGSYRPNKLGLYDMHGNVFEWCHELDRTAPGGPFAVARGGGFWDHSGSGFCRTAHRGLFPPTTVNDAIGLRVARVPVGKPDETPNAPTSTDAWVQQVAALPPAKQVEAVAAKLSERNPGFDGKMTHKIEQGEVVELGMSGRIKDLSPVRALTELRVLNCTDTPVSDLSPLKGMKLTTLQFYSTKVSDLSPLKGMPLAKLHCDGTNVTDLSPLKGMDLLELNVSNSPLSDLSPLKGVKVRTLHFWHSGVTDASLAVLPQVPGLRNLGLVGEGFTDAGLEHIGKLSDLETLGVGRSKFTGAGLIHLKGMTRLYALHLFESPVTDEALTHLKVLPGLRELVLHRTRVTDAGLKHLAGLKDLTRLDLRETAVTDKGITQLKAALPGCQVIR